MPVVLTIKGRIMCPHGGTAPASSLQGHNRHTMGALNILCEDNTGSVPFTCMNTPPCTAVTSWVPNQRIVKVDGCCVLTDASIPVTNNGPGTVADAGQQKIRVK